MAVDSLAQCVDSLRQCLVMHEEISAVAYWPLALLWFVIAFAAGLFAGLLLSDWLDERLDRWAYQQQFLADSRDATPR